MKSEGVAIDKYMYLLYAPYFIIMVIESDRDLWKFSRADKKRKEWQSFVADGNDRILSVNGMPLTILLYRWNEKQGNEMQRKNDRDLHFDCTFLY